MSVDCATYEQTADPAIFDGYAGSAVVVDLAVTVAAEATAEATEQENVRMRDLIVALSFGMRTGVKKNRLTHERPNSFRPVGLRKDVCRLWSLPRQQSLREGGDKYHWH